MTDGLLPPFAEPHGPSADDHAVLAAFVRGEPAGHSTRFHVEPPTLVAFGDIAMALRVGPSTVLVRADAPSAGAEAKPVVEAFLASEGMKCLDEDTLLAAPVAVQVLALRMSSWDLWGRDIDESFAALRAAVLGEEATPVVVQSEPTPPLDFEIPDYPPPG